MSKGAREYLNNMDIRSDQNIEVRLWTGNDYKVLSLYKLMQNYADYSYQDKLHEITDKILKKEAKIIQSEYQPKFKGVAHMVHRRTTVWLLNKLKQKI